MISEDCVLRISKIVRPRSTPSLLTGELITKIPEKDGSLHGP
jgi:hypothetical protein